MKCSLNHANAENQTINQYEKCEIQADTQRGNERDSLRLQLTIIESLTDYELPIGMFHLHMLLKVRQSVYPSLRERHQQHIKRHASQSVVLRLYIRVLPLISLLLDLILTPLEFGGVR